MQSSGPAECGTAFHRDFTSVSCGKDLEGRKTTATVLLIAGGALMLGAGVFKDPAKGKAPSGV